MFLHSLPYCLSTLTTHTRAHTHTHTYTVNTDTRPLSTTTTLNSKLGDAAMQLLVCPPCGACHVRLSPPSTSRARRLHRYSKSSPGINVVSDVIHRSGSSPPAHPCKRSALCPFGLACRETFGSDRESRWGSGPVALIMTSAACHHLRTGSQPQPLVLVLAQPRPTDSSGLSPQKPSNGIRAAAQP